MATFQLSIATPEETIFDEMVESIVVPGAQGYLGVMANHAALITPLKPGKITIHFPGEKEEMLAVSGGFLEVAQNRATILADAAENANKIDRARAIAARNRANERLQNRHENLDVDRANAALHRALNRIRITDELHASGQ